MTVSIGARLGSDEVVAAIGAGGMGEVYRAHDTNRRDLSLMSNLISKAQEKGKGFGPFHHTAFTIARAYALAGEAPEAVRWLEQTAADGHPGYPVFAQDSALDPIRRDVASQRFLSVQRTRWEALKQLAP